MAHLLSLVIASVSIADRGECSLPPGFDLDPAVSFPVGAIPHVLIAADLDGDGNLDLVSSDRPDDTLSVLMGEGGGGFAAASMLATGNEPRGIGAADLDNDGDLDLASGNASEDNIGDLPTSSILLGNGDGTFAPRADHSALPFQAGALRALALVDLDADGDTDIVNGFAGNDTGGVLGILLSGGGGTFSAPDVITALLPGFEGFTSARYIAAGAVDGDALTDIVTMSGQTLINPGDGRLAIPVTFAAVSDGKGVTLADTDLDGDLDAAIVRTFLEGEAARGEVLLFLNGDGSLGSGPGPVQIPAQLQEGIAARDLDEDGRVDLAVTLFDSQVAVILQDGDGVFQAPDRYFPLEAGTPRWVLSADLDGDDRPDIAVPRSDGFVSVLLSRNGRDDNGDGVRDECEARFFRGDPDGDGRASLTDAIRILDRLFRGEEAFPCLESADTNDDARIDISDAVFLLEFLFLGGAPPPPPGPPSGADCPSGAPAGLDLGCASYGGCAP